MTILAEDPDGVGTGAGAELDTLRALLDAIHHEDDRIAGRAVTRLRNDLAVDEIDNADVDSTLGFGEYVNGAEDGVLLIGGELVYFEARNNNVPFQFQTLTRGYRGTEALRHPAGTLVFDYSGNRAAVELVRRGLLVDTAVGEDLQRIGRNLGLTFCVGMSEEAYRRVIKAVAYLPRQTLHAFRQALNALYDGSTDWTAYERLASSPWDVFIDLVATYSADIRGRFLLNGGEETVTTGANTVDVAHAPSSVFRVVLATEATRRGYRDGVTDYYGAGSVLGTTITLGSSPGAAGTAVIVDYNAHRGHYLAANETVRQDSADADHWAYLADPTRTARCLLEQIRAAGVRVNVRSVTP